MPPATSVTIEFDSNVIKVEIYADANRINLNTTITTSGSSYNIIPQFTYYPKVYMTDGYIIDEVVSTYGTNNLNGNIINNVTNDTFDFVETSNGDTITITSKKTTSQVSIGLTTLSGWGNVTSGNHVIQVVAKADGYKDSEKSTAVSFTKTPPLVTIPAGTYKFVDTPTTNWASSYITDIAYKSDNVSYTKMYLGTDTLDNKGIGYNWYPSTNGMKGYVANHGWGTHSFNSDGEWTSVTANTNLQKITIETDQQVSQEFKTWFDANTNVVTGHTLTSSSITPNNIEVNGTALTSLPYTLQNGDTIQVTYALDDSAITVNGVKQTSNYQTYNLSNTDIIVEGVDGNIEFPSVTINYTA